MSNQSQENSSSDQLDLSPQMKALSFLLGEWQAINSPDESTGGFRFAPQLQSRIIVRTNYADYPAANNQAAYHHEDLMIVYQDETLGLRADYFDSEGHVIRYALQGIRPNEVVFTSEPTDSAPGYRLRYLLQSDGILAGTFEIAQPNQPDTFTLYLSWTARKEDHV